MLYFYIGIFMLFAISNPIFYIGYTKSNVAVNNDNVNSNGSSDRVVDEVYLMVVDSLRTEMIFNRSALWPNLYNKLKNKTSYDFGRYPTAARLQPPSMSYAMIKSMITGSVVSFNDVIWNTAASEISQDNFVDIMQCGKAGGGSPTSWHCEYAGDDTWVHVLPQRWEHELPVAPFFVMDKSGGVDSGINKAISGHPNSGGSKWLHVTHYIGLDHLGHREGPYGANVPAKLMEMDRYLGGALDRLRKSGSSSPLLLLTADHGMSDLGGHGGAASTELTVPLIFMHPKLKHFDNFTNGKLTADPSIMQVDIATIIALLTGHAIPQNSIGILPMPLAALFTTDESRTRVLLRNYRHLYSLLQRRSKNIVENQIIHQRFSLIFKKLNQKLSIGNINNTNTSTSSGFLYSTFHQLHSDLVSVMRDIQSILISNSLYQHNFIIIDFSLLLALIPIVLCFYHQHVIVSSSVHNHQIGPITFCLLILSVFSFCTTLLIVPHSAFCLYRISKVIISSFMILFTLHSLHMIKFVIVYLKNFYKTAKHEQKLMLVCLIGLILSRLHPQLMQEEHSMWYLVNFTILIVGPVLLWLGVRQNQNQYQQQQQQQQQQQKKNQLPAVNGIIIAEKKSEDSNATNRNDNRNVNKSGNMNNYQTVLLLLLILIADRIAVRVNQTGELYAFQRDFGDMLYKKENKALLVTTVIISSTIISLLAWIKYQASVALLVQLFSAVALVRRLVEISDQIVVANWIARSCYFSLIIFLLYFLMRWGVGKFRNNKCYVNKNNDINNNYIEKYCHSGKTTTATSVTMDSSKPPSSSATSESYNLSATHQVKCQQNLQLPSRQKHNLSGIHWSLLLMMLNVLMARHHNLLIWALVMLKHHCITSLWSSGYMNDQSVFYKVFLFKIFGTVTFYQLGNSNSLATLDVVPGFVGLNSYVAVFVDPMVWYSIFSGYWYWLTVSLELITFSTTTTTTTTTMSSDSCTSTSISNSSDKTVEQPFRSIFIAWILLASLFSMAIYTGALLYSHDKASVNLYVPAQLYNFFLNNMFVCLICMCAKFRYL